MKFNKLPDDYGTGINKLGPVRHVATVLEDARVAGAGVSFEQILVGYEHTPFGDLNRIRKRYGTKDTGEAMAALFRDMLVELGNEVVEADSLYMLRRPLAQIRWHGSVIHESRPYVPTEADKILKHGYREGNGDLSDLIESLQLGYNPDLGGYIIRDLRSGNIISGRRRMAAAKRAGIDLSGFIRDIDFSDNADSIDAMWQANTGRRPTPKENERIQKARAETKAARAERLAEVERLTAEGLSQRAIAKQVGASKTQVLKDQRSLVSERPPRPKRASSSEVTGAVREATRRHMEEGVSEEKAAQEAGVSRHAVRDEKKREEGRLQILKPDGSEGETFTYQTRYRWPVPSNVEALIDTMESTWPELEFLLTGRSPELAERFGRQWSRAIEDLKLEVSE